MAGEAAARDGRPQNRERVAQGPARRIQPQARRGERRDEKIEADCNERIAFIEEKFELDTASLELENNELHAASVRYLADARELDRQVAQLHAEAVAMVDEIERLRGERDAALKAQAELNDALLAQRDLMAEVAALKDRLAATEQRAAVAEAKVEVMTQMKDE